MKKFYSMILLALMAMMMPATAKAQVTINDLRGTYVFHGKTNDWSGFGVVPPSSATITLSINEADNSVTMTGFLGADVVIWGDEGDDPVYDALHGTFNPETQQIVFLDTETSADWFTLSDNYYDWYIYNLVFQASKDEDGNVVLDLAPAANGNLCILQTYYYDNDAADYVYVNYGYDWGGRMTLLSANAKSCIGTLEPGNYEIIYTDRNDVQGMMPATVAEADGQLTITTNDVTVALEAQTAGRGANKYTYAYKTNGCYDTYYYWGEGEDDYEYSFIPQYWGKSELTLYFNGDEPMKFDTGIWFGIGESGISVFDCVLAKEGTFVDGIEAITETSSTGVQYFDLQGRRIAQPRGITIVQENGKTRKTIVKR